MKDLRFLLQDYARFSHYQNFDIFVFYNPMTGKEKDLAICRLDDIVHMPSLKWKGSFTSFRMQFETQLNHEFFYPNKDKVLKNETLAKLDQIRGWLTNSYKAQAQLLENLNSTYRAGFQPEHSFYFELWVNSQHPHYLKDLPNYNMIFKREIDMDDFDLHIVTLQILQTMNETDILCVERLKFVYQPRYTYENY